MSDHMENGGTGDIEEFLQAQSEGKGGTDEVAEGITIVARCRQQQAHMLEMELRLTRENYPDEADRLVQKATALHEPLIRRRMKAVRCKIKDWLHRSRNIWTALARALPSALAPANTRFFAWTRSKSKAWL